MKESRWLRWVGPGLIGLAVAGSVATVATGAASRPWIARACEDDLDVRRSTAQWSDPIGLADLAAQPWYRLDASLDPEGVLDGQRLSFGVDGDRVARFLVLPPESFAAGPFGRVVLAGFDDGAASRLHLLDVGRDCASLVATESDVIRRATIDPTGRTIYEMRVDRATRSDLGVWARSTDGSSSPVRVLEPMPFDEQFGRTFTTEFAWDVAGRRLAVESCGEVACRARVFDPATGEALVVAEPELASMIGLDGSTMVSYLACPGLPCPIVATDVSTGQRRVLADAGFGAVLTTANGAPMLVHEVSLGSGVGLRTIGLDGNGSGDLGTIPDGLRLHPSAIRAGDATRLPDGFVLLGVDGRLPVNGPRGEVELRQVSDGTAVQVNEVTR